MSSLICEPNTDFHLQLNEQSFHIPYTLLQRNYKQFHALVEKESVVLQKKIAELNLLLSEDTLDQDKIALTKLNTVIKNLDVFEKKVNQKLETEYELLNRIKARIQFFNELEEAKETGNRRKLIDWYQKYTNLLIGDYLTRNSKLHGNKGLFILNAADDKEYWNPGEAFLKQQQLDHLLDYDILLNANKISKALTESHELKPLISWIKENQQYLLARSSELQFKARLQEYIELLRNQQNSKAVLCLQTNLLPFLNTNFDDIKTACGLIVYIESCNKNKQYNFINSTKLEEHQKARENKKLDELCTSKRDAYQYFFHKSLPVDNLPEPSINVESNGQFFSSENLVQYMELLDEMRWVELDELFLEEYYSLFGIGKNDPLLIYLSLGISTLKTRDCLNHENDIPTEFDILESNLQQHGVKNTCPVCSEAFAPISENLPYAHHTESRLFENPVMLPNGNVYDAKKLKNLSINLTKRKIFPLQKGEVLDPIDKRVYLETDFIKMYPT